jgi:hypothetical protein
MTRVLRSRLPHRVLRPIGVFTVMTSALILAGCGPKPSFVLDSDVPAPQDASGRATSGIQRRGDELVGVETVFADDVDDPQAALATLRDRFIAGGWTMATGGATGSTATAVFRKGDRRCRVRVVRNDLDPAMSRIAYRLDTVDDEADPKDA